MNLTSTKSNNNNNSSLLKVNLMKQSFLFLVLALLINCMDQFTFINGVSALELTGKNDNKILDKGWWVENNKYTDNCYLVCIILSIIVVCCGAGSGLFIYNRDVKPSNVRIRELGNCDFAIRTVYGDGNCLFYSVGMVSRTNAWNLRQSVANYLKKNQARFEFFIDLDEYRSFDEYISEIRQDGTFGDDLEITCLEEILGVKIFVWEKDPPMRTRRQGEDILLNDEKTIHLYRTNFEGVPPHYDYMVQKTPGKNFIANQVGKKTNKKKTIAKTYGTNNDNNV